MGAPRPPRSRPVPRRRGRRRRSRAASPRARAPAISMSSAARCGRSPSSSRGAREAPRDRPRRSLGSTSTRPWRSPRIRGSPGSSASACVGPPRTSRRRRLASACAPGEPEVRDRRGGQAEAAAGVGARPRRGEAAVPVEGHQRVVGEAEVHHGHGDQCAVAGRQVPSGPHGPVPRRRPSRGWRARGGPAGSHGGHPVALGELGGPLEPGTGRPGASPVPRAVRPSTPSASHSTACWPVRSRRGERGSCPAARRRRAAPGRARRRRRRASSRAPSASASSPSMWGSRLRAVATSWSAAVTPPAASAARAVTRSRSTRRACVHRRPAGRAAWRAQRPRLPGLARRGEHPHEHLVGVARHRLGRGRRSGRRGGRWPRRWSARPPPSARRALSRNAGRGDRARPPPPPTPRRARTGAPGQPRMGPLDRWPARRGQPHPVRRQQVGRARPPG